LDLGGVYLAIAEQLETGELIDFAASNKTLGDEVAQTLGRDAGKWAEWKEKVGEKFNKELAGGTRFDVIEAYRLVALGLGSTLIETGARE
jgi:hypothetical protein